MLGQVKIIAVQETDVLARAVRKSIIAGCAAFCILLLYTFNARIGFHKGMHHLARIIGRAIVHNNQLPIGERLLLHAENCIGNAPRPVVGGNDDRKERCGNHEFISATGL